MRKLFIAPLVLALGSLVGCADSHESLAEETFDLFEEIAETLESVKDEASAKAAAKKIKGLSADLKEVSERVKKLDKLSGEEEEKLKEKLSDRGKEVIARLFAASMKIPEALRGGELEEAMNSIPDMQ